MLLRDSSLAQRLAAATAQADVFRAIVERQQTTKSLWAPPTPAFRRKDAEARDLESRLTVALAHAGDSLVRRVLLCAAWRLAGPAGPRPGLR